MRANETADALALRRLAAAGADLAKPYLTRYYLYFPDERRAQAAQEELARSGFVAERITPAAQGRDWLLLVVKQTLPTRISEMSLQLSVAARKHDGEYDGWEVEVGK